MITEEEYFKFIEYCNKRELISIGDSPTVTLKVMTTDLEIVEANGCSYNDALDNLNIALKARLRRKIDTLCEELKILEDTEL